MDMRVCLLIFVFSAWPGIVVILFFVLLLLLGLLDKILSVCLGGGNSAPLALKSTHDIDAAKRQSSTRNHP